MMSREDEIQILCREIFQLKAESWEGHFSCTFCGKVNQDYNCHGSKTLREIEHNSDCAYLIAKDLAV